MRVPLSEGAGAAGSTDRIFPSSTTIVMSFCSVIFSLPSKSVQCRYVVFIFCLLILLNAELKVSEIENAASVI